MTLKFDDLALTDKALLIAEYGVWLQSVEYYDYWVHLYSLHSHFIEIFYSINTRQIDRITMANKLDMNKHLDRIIIKL